MTILVVGLSHRTAPLSVLEQAALTGDGVDRLLTDVAAAETIGEAVLLATCNRLEIYADVEKFHTSVAGITQALTQHTGLALEALTPHLYVHYDERAVQHLFRVACGLDSMVVGEAQILGQIKGALALAQKLGTAGRVLNELVQQALRVGKRAHTETEIDKAGQSLVTVGLEAAEEAIGPITGKTALIVGAGSVSALAAATLRRAGVGRIVIANRTYERGARVAASVGGEAIPFDRTGEALADADLLVSCTGAAGLVIDTDQVAAAMRQRPGRPLFVLDLALPHDVDQAVADLEEVTLVNLERISERVADDRRLPSVEQVQRIVAEEVAEFAGWQRSVRVAPTVVALRARAAEVVASELDRLAGRLPELDERQRDEVAQTVRRVVDKLLHTPTVRVKEMARRPDGVSYADVLRELFDLDPQAVEAVTAPETEEGVS
ncbi:glutamyl-tRNA reductase [Carbonactinospora thermoautotrophica]|uniref:Glutamyl-tRNA reductase n=2 Tax=Carbonactinospora thermoautotrophica TaxID=1469144 RepID=A0A132MJY3_9ACTN|nr:glutamyl-tRNA reductase [Carbonactinospora thermoautotrophica]KWW98146.1 glutamyl-tRNA reductase [Carbonactinospora thermoautotrophica]KWX02835.1 Glutamyl-tRNA reductase [Carbonactinospora thermoautotrophica]